MFRTLVVLIFSLLAASIEAAPQTLASARLWPGADYTRLTFESAKPIRHNMTVLNKPDRLVLDLQNVSLDSSLKNLSSKVQGGDPYVQKIRASVFKPGIVRVVIELKGESKPSLFAVKPAGNYKHRLVLDIYPKLDPLMALLEQQSKKQDDSATEATLPAGKPVTVVLAAEPAEDSLPDEATPGANDSVPSKDNVERLITVAIDAGHGGEDSGARGATGTLEKDVTLSIAKRLKAMIDAEPNMRGVLTRDSDFFIPLHGRVVKARKLQADLFVSIHADAFTRPDARGSSVFALSERGATSAMARMLAQRENESDLIGGVNIDTKDPYLARTLLDLSQTATISDSLKLGKAVLGHLGEINDLHKNAVEQAGFAVLKSPDIPSILVETAFISNPEEERKLNDDDYQVTLANAILSGIKRYFASNPPLAKSKLVLNEK